MFQYFSIMFIFILGLFQWSDDFYQTHQCEQSCIRKRSDPLSHQVRRVEVKINRICNSFDVVVSRVDLLLSWLLDIGRIATIYSLNMHYTLGVEHFIYYQTV